MLIILFLIVKLFFPSTALAVKEKEYEAGFEVVSEWIRVKKKDGISLYERWIQVSDQIKVRERKGEMTVNCNISEATRYLSQAQTIKEWMKSVSLVADIDNGTEEVNLSRIVFNLPWPFGDRDITVVFQVFYIDTSHCIVKLMSYEGIDEDPEVKRIKGYRASWRLRQLDDRRTKIELVTFSEEPPLFPLWMQDPVVVKVFYKNLLRLKGCLSSLDNDIL